MMVRTPSVRFVAKHTLHIQLYHFRMGHEESDEGKVVEPDPQSADAAHFMKIKLGNLVSELLTKISKVTRSQILTQIRRLELGQDAELRIQAIRCYSQRLSPLGPLSFSVRVQPLSHFLCFDKASILHNQLHRGGGVASCPCRHANFVTPLRCHLVIFLRPNWLEHSSLMSYWSKARGSTHKQAHTFLILFRICLEKLWRYNCSR